MKNNRDTRIARQVYEQHHGSIPKEENGRTYEVHHLDGNHENNDIKNLKAVTLQEHYDIHYSQGDYGACYLMAIQRMSLSPKELSDIARKNARKQIDEGTHPFVNLEVRARADRKRKENGTHNWLGGDHSRKLNKKRVADGTHNFLGESNPSHERVKNGTHNFLDPIQRDRTGKLNHQYQTERVKNGTHHLLGGKIQRQMVDSGKHNLVGGVTCRDKSGKVTQVAKDKYWAQTGNKEDWEYVSINCLEGKKRKQQGKYHE